MATIQIIALRVVLIGVGLIILLSFLQFFIGIHPPRYYDRTSPKDYGLKYENISFKTSDNVTIKGWLLVSDKSNGTVIVGHGYPFDKGNIFPVAKFLYPDYNLLLYDHRYFGESSGKVTTGGFRESRDVNAAVKFVKDRFGESNPVALYGFSLSASAMLMAKPNVNAIIADSPYADLNRMVKRMFFLFGPLKFPFVFTTDLLTRIFFKTSLRDVSPANAVKGYHVPILLIHGEKDSQIPVENAYAIKESNPNIELWVVKGADHGFSYALAKDEYHKRIKSFLTKHMVD